MEIREIIAVIGVVALIALIFYSAWSKRYTVEIGTRSAHIAYAVLTRFKDHARFAHFKLHEGISDVEYEKAIDELNQKVPLNTTKSSDVRRYMPGRHYPINYTRSSEEGD